MIDFFLGVIVGAVAILAVLHFSGRLSAKAEANLSTLEQKVRNLMSAMDDAMAKLATAVEAAKAKAVSDALAAQPVVDAVTVAADQENTDAAKVDAFSDALNPPG